MFPVDLLSSMVNAIVGAVATDSTDTVMSKARRSDSPRKFAREFFAFYEDLKRYSYIANYTALFVEELGSPDLTSWRRDDLMGFINKSADELAGIMGSLMDRFAPDPREIDYPDWADDEPQPSKRALRRAAIMEIYDPRLVELARASYRMDFWVVSALARIDNLHFDKERNEVQVNLDTSYDIASILSCVEEWVRTGGEGLTDAYSLSDNKEIISKISGIVRDNAVVVEQLREKVRDALREHFSLEELL